MYGHTLHDRRCLAIITLVDLDAPLTDYVEVPFDAQGATVRQVLAMRSGFPEFPGDLYQKVIKEDLDREWTVPEVLAILPEDSPRLGTLGKSFSLNLPRLSLTSGTEPAFLPRGYSTRSWCCGRRML